VRIKHEDLQPSKQQEQSALLTGKNTCTVLLLSTCSSARIPSNASTSRWNGFPSDKLVTYNAQQCKWGGCAVTRLYGGFSSSHRSKITHKKGSFFTREREAS
jgi:hypothetical protein